MAGSGKSSFTLKLCAELDDKGFLPLRVRLRSLELDAKTPIRELIVRALLPRNKELPEHLRHAPLDDPFEAGIFNDRRNWHGAEIRSYVLILDGWDEVSLGAKDGFKAQVDEMLRQVRDEFLGSKQKVPVRVILTGRPTPEVSDNSSLMRPLTPVLTIRPLSPEALGRFVDKMRRALELWPLSTSLKSGGKLPLVWRMPERRVLEPVLDAYKSEFKPLVIIGKGPSAVPVPTRPHSDSSALMGLPLLAYLSLRLLGRWRGSPEDLIKNSTRLYRHLLEVTCAGRGQASASALKDDQRKFHPHGLDLRTLLHEVAIAMTASTREAIGYEELRLRMERAEEDFNQQVAEADKQFHLSTTVVAFFFKGGLRHLGCEFMHKSFREYLFAEAIVEMLKNYDGRDCSPEALHREYSQDFDKCHSKDAPLYAFSRSLSVLLSPNWLKAEVLTHLQRLLVWEISRLTKRDGSAEEDETEDGELSRLSARSLVQWKNIRDALAEIWQWWAEGVHMRPQVKPGRPNPKNLTSSYAEKLVELDAPRLPTEEWPLEPARTTSMDAHMGDGLFRLCASVHYQVAIAEGWLTSELGQQERPGPMELWWGVDDGKKRKPNGMRECQAVIVQERGTFVLFAPSCSDPLFYPQFVARINAAAWRPCGFFPAGVDMRGVDLRGSWIAPSSLRDTGGPATILWSHANLSLANVWGGCLEEDDFSEVNAQSTAFVLAFLRRANFRGAFLQTASFQHAYAGEAGFSRSDVSDVNFSDAFLGECQFDGAEFSRGDVGWRNTSWKGTNLKGATGLPDWVLEEAASE